VLIAFASVPIGIAFSALGLKWLDRAIPPQEAVPYYIDWSLNWRVVVYTVVVALATGLLFGLAPAMHAVRASLQDSLKDRSGAGASRNRLRGGLVVAEIGLSLVLLVGASLFIRSFLNLQQASAGFDTSTLTTLRFYMPGDPYASGDAMTRRVDDIMRRVEALPGVEAAAASNLVPLSGGGDGGTAVPDGATFAPNDVPRIAFYGVTPHFFRALNVKPIAGRDFTDADGAGKTHVAIVNQVMAKRLWPNTSDVVGQRFRFVNEANDDTMTVVGVVPDVKIDGMRERRPVARAFASYAHSPARNTGITLRVSGGAPAALTQAIRQQIHGSDPALPVFAEQSMDEVRELSFWQYRLFGWMFSIFGGIALALAAVGVYGVLSYAVSQRRQEIGVRMALGASRQSVFALFVGHGARLAAVGIVCGMIGAFAVTRIVNSLLYNVSATDPLSFIATAAFLAAVAILASYVPARRATGVDPMIALRAE
jgi:putative ABC transport system permease protein